ncbi:VOC family protein [Nocardia sp. NPDC101769]|uniref:VOC family protein n=1 Tax=Nocardia sp. NPDC101769 TaxID=3364333 RepID=UPI003802ECD2
MAPSLAGVHHLKLPVSDLSAGIAWFETALGARRLEKFDHCHPDGTLFGVIMMLPGVAIPVELRLNPLAATAIAGFDPVTLGVDGVEGLRRWAAHLDEVGVEHSPIITGFIGHLIEFRTPDGLCVRIYTNPPNGFAHAHMRSPHDLV